MRFPDVPREIADIGLSCPDMDHCRQRMTHRPTVTGTLLELIWRTTETTALNPLGAAFWKRCCEFVTRVRETFIFSGRNPGNQRLPKGLQASVSKDSRSNQRLDRRFRRSVRKVQECELEQPGSSYAHRIQNRFRAIRKRCRILQRRRSSVSQWHGLGPAQSTAMAPWPARTFLVSDIRGMNGRLMGPAVPNRRRSVCLTFVWVARSSRAMTEMGMRAVEIKGKAQRTPATRNPLQSDFEHHPPRHRAA